VFLERFVTAGQNMDVCFSVTALKTGGINATLACPPFSVFAATDFAAVGIADTPNRCAPDVELTINDCWFNITAFMAARCDGLAACTFSSATDLAASNFSLHACASYTYAPTITLDFYAQCRTTAQDAVPNPVFVGAAGTTQAVATGATDSCPAQLRVALASPAAPPQLSLVIELPGQWGLHTVSLQVVSYLLPTRALYGLIPDVQFGLLYSAGGAPFVGANYPGTVSTASDVPAQRFAGQCPALYTAELPRTPTTDVFVVFGDIVDAPPDAIQLDITNALPGEVFYIANIVIASSNGTTLTYLPASGTVLSPYTVRCATCTARYVSSLILVDAGIPRPN
jgi:hypothetical protein